MILDTNWKSKLEEIEHKYYVTSEDSGFADYVEWEDLDFLVNLVNELKEKAFA